MGVTSEKFPRAVRVKSENFSGGWDLDPGKTTGGRNDRVKVRGLGSFIEAGPSRQQPSHRPTRVDLI